MTIYQFFPVWDQLAPQQRELISASAASRAVPNGTLLHSGSADCVGLFLVRAGQSVWQILPVGPTGFGDSPYQSCSAFAGNPYLIDLDLLAADGLLARAD